MTNDRISRVLNGQDPGRLDGDAGTVIVDSGKESDLPHRAVPAMRASRDSALPGPLPGGQWEGIMGPSRYFVREAIPVRRRGKTVWAVTFAGVEKQPRRPSDPSASRELVVMASTATFDEKISGERYYTHSEIESFAEPKERGAFWARRFQGGRRERKATDPKR